MNGIDSMLTQAGLGHSLSLTDSVLQLTLALILNLGLALLYTHLNHGRKKVHLLAHSMVYIGLIMTGAMLLISTNLVVAVGLFGAVSIVRFRTTVENPIDMSFIFLAVVVGISCGLGFLYHAILLAVFVGAVIFGLHKLGLGMGKSESVARNDCTITVTAKKTIFTPEMIDNLRTLMGTDDQLMEIRTKKNKISLKIRRDHMDLEEIQRLQIMLEPFYREDPSMELAVLRA